VEQNKKYMKSTEVKVGQKFETFYGNGQASGIDIVVRITDKSLFVTKKEGGQEYREALTSVQKYLDKKLWIPIV